jgi:hypothetical protein
MFKHNNLTALALSAALGAGALLTAPSAYARSTFVSPWLSQYPGSDSLNNATPDGCQLCHSTASGSGRNAYGADLDSVMPSNPSTSELIAALIAIESDDSDSDPTGSSNIVEIDADTQPGWTVGDNPSGVIGDLDPVTPVADISVSPLSVDFGAVTVGASGADSVAISNVGSADLTVDSLSLSGSSEFSLPGAPATPFTIAANTSVNVSVEYAPLNEGLDNATLAIASDSPGEELISVALSGTGVPVQVNECVPVVDPASLAFGSVELGNTSSLTTTVTNNGTLECAVEATVSGSGEFGLASVAMFTVAPGDSVDVSVAYTPADLGDDAGNLALVFPDRTIDVPLIGSGIEAPVEVVDLDIKSFRVTKKISLTRVKAVVIKLTVNNGGVTEGFAPATVTGVQNGGVVHTQTLEVTDAVGNGSTRYTLDPFTPTAAGDIEWTMVIADGDPDDDVAIATTTVNP